MLLSKIKSLISYKLVLDITQNERLYVTKTNLARRIFVNQCPYYVQKPKEKNCTTLTASVAAKKSSVFKECFDMWLADTEQ